MSAAAATPSSGALDLLSVFNVLPGANLLLAPDLCIVAASDDYLAATLTERATLVGQHLFDAFPDNPQAPEANAVANVHAALRQVLATRLLYELAPQHYDVPDPAQPGHFVERHWLLRHTPVLDAAGQVQFVIQSVQDITTSRLAQQQLLESQSGEQKARAETAHQRTEFRHFMEQAPVAMAVYRGPQFRVEHANAATLATWDRSLDAVLDRPVFEALPEAATPEVVALFERVFTSGVPQTVHEQATTIHRHGRSEVVYWTFVFLPQYGPDGKVSGLLTVGTDVTEQVRARQQVAQLNQELETRVQARTQAGLALQAELLAAAQRQTQERTAFRNVFEQTPALIALVRAPGHRVEYVNPAYQALFLGRQLVGLDLVEAVPEMRAPGYIARLDHVYETGETYFGAEEPFAPVPVEDQTLRTQYFNFTYQAYREDGAIAGVTIFAYDVTEQVEARQQREAERQQLHALFMEAPAPIVILDGADLVFQLVNPAYQRVFPGRALLGKPVLEALPEIAGMVIYQSLRGVYDTGETYVEQELPLQLARHDEGPLEEMFFTFTYQARRNAPGEPDGVLVFAHEVTDQVLARRVVEEGGQQARALAAELAASNAQLTRTNADLDNFIYTASHDLKTPISNIEGLLYLLQEELPAAVTQQAHVGSALTRMLDAVERFKRTIGHLTDVTKLQKEHAPTIALVDLAAVVEDVRQDLLPLLQASGTKLVVNVPALPPVQFSEKNLRSIVYNLLSNAVKYHSPDRLPRVDVRAHVRVGHTVLEVHDNGLGMAEYQLPRLFGMFQRFHDHVEGAGIGLYMVKRMVENAGGRIEVHTQLGAGTTFFVHLPHGAPPTA
jgi:signal transduction histidine kinase